ncbi:MAG: SWIM zinc finger family protein [Anaerolineae bacterium]
MKDNTDWWHELSEPIPVKDGVKAHSQSGSFTKNWWAKRWLQALVQLMDPNRLSRGRQYARAGQVISLEVQLGLVLAQVQGTRPRPYRQRIELRQFSDAEWEHALTQLASQALFSAQLLNGEMPQNIEEAFEGANLHLFPSVASDISMSCTCPDWARPCKHLAAILLLLGESLDTDPFLLFVMRGRNREQLMAALRDRRAAYAGGAGTPVVSNLASDAAAETIDLEAKNFWKMGDTSAIQVHVANPEVDLEVLKLLGDPSFTGDKALVEKLEVVYHQVTRRALEVAYATRGEETGANNASDPEMPEEPSS